MLAVAGRSCYLQCFALTPAQPKRSNWGRCQVLQPAISIATSLLLLLGRHSLQWLILNQKQRISRRSRVAQMRSWICWMECPRKLRYSCGSSWKASKQTAWFYGSASSSITSKKNLPLVLQRLQFVLNNFRDWWSCCCHLFCWFRLDSTNATQISQNWALGTEIEERANPWNYSENEPYLRRIVT